MQQMQSADDWKKVRKLARQWYTHTGWVVPSWVYMAGAVVSFIVVFIDKDRSLIWVLVLSFCVAKLYGREKEIEGYIEGWSQAQEFMSGTDTIEELSDWSKETKKVNKS